MPPPPSLPMLLVTLDADAEGRAVIAAAIGEKARIVHLTDLPPDERARALATATVLLSRQTGTELRAGEAAMLGQARLIQFATAGVDHVALAGIPHHVAIACNGGGYAEPMAEHALAMTLCALKRLPAEHAKVASGTFDQFRPNRMLAGSVFTR